MTPVLFSTAYIILLGAISYYLIDGLICKTQSKPIHIHVTGPVCLRPIEIQGNGHNAAELLAGIVFAVVEGAAGIATAKGKP